MDHGGGPVDDELVGLFDLSHDAFCIAGFDGYLKRANPALPRILGYTLEELLAGPLIESIYRDDRESVEAFLAELATGNAVVGFECRHVCADGSMRWLEWSTSSPARSGPPGPSSWLAKTNRMFQSTRVDARSTGTRGERDEQSITNHHRCRLSRRQ